MPELLRAVAEQGYQEPTPIQLQAIPPVLQRHDLMGCAQTGTGKTAGFTLPILQLLAPQANTSPSPARHPVRALILAPTRELAAQVEESVRTYGKHLALRTTVVYGGVDIGPQIKALHAGVEILVATPGRLLDHLHQKTLNLSRVEILVLDEGDRMLDMGFFPDIKRILRPFRPDGKTCSSRPRFRKKCVGSRRTSCTPPSWLKSRAATPPPTSSRMRSTWCPHCESARCLRTLSAAGTCARRWYLSA